MSGSRVKNKRLKGWNSKIIKKGNRDVWIERMKKKMEELISEIEE